MMTASIPAFNMGRFIIPHRNPVYKYTGIHWISVSYYESGVKGHHVQYYSYCCTGGR